MSEKQENLVEWYREQQESLKIDVVDQGLATLVGMVGRGSIDVSPHFQRRDRWDQVRQSRLIESFLRNIPIPPVYQRRIECVLAGMLSLMANRG